MLKSNIQGISAVDLSDDRRLLGINHYFVVGKVTGEGEPLIVDTYTLRKYTVDVLVSIKGQLQGPTEVYAVDKLNPGSTYVMGLRWNWHDLRKLIVSVEGRTLFSEDATLSNDQLKVLAEESDRLKALRNAYPTEILFPLDILQNTTWNSYESLRAGKLFIPGMDEYPLKTRYIDVGQATDYSDDRKLVGSAAYVFIAKVEEQIASNFANEVTPVSRFKVEVVKNIKGELQGIVTVQQRIGYVNGTCIIARTSGSYLYRNGCSDALLHPGSTYVISAWHDKYGPIVMGVPPYDVELISNESLLSIADLTGIAEQNERVKALQRAYPNEIPSESARENNFVYNSYESLKAGHLLTPPPFADGVITMFAHQSQPSTASESMPMSSPEPMSAQSAGGPSAPSGSGEPTPSVSEPTASLVPAQPAPSAMTSPLVEPVLSSPSDMPTSEPIMRIPASTENSAAATSTPEPATPAPELLPSI